MDSYLGEIRLFAGNYAPMDWHICDGTKLLIRDYQALYALMGIQFGGDGVNNFALPDLRGRVPIGQGAGTGLTSRVVAQTGGAETVTLTAAQIPAHAHSLNAYEAAGTIGSPANAMLAIPTNTSSFYAPPQTPDATVFLDDGSVQSNVGGAPHNNYMPSQALSYIIALVGIYPQQN